MWCEQDVCLFTMIHKLFGCRFADFLFYSACVDKSQQFMHIFKVTEKMPKIMIFAQKKNCSQIKCVVSRLVFNENVAEERRVANALSFSFLLDRPNQECILLQFPLFISFFDMPDTHNIIECSDIPFPRSDRIKNVSHNVHTTRIIHRKLLIECS